MPCTNNCPVGTFPVCPYCGWLEFGTAPAPYDRLCQCAPKGDGGCGRKFLAPYCMTEVEMAAQMEAASKAKTEADTE